MPQSLVKNLVHLVFSTKHRGAILTDAVRPELHAYMGGILRDLDSPELAINSMADHVHLLINLHKTRALADVVMELKRGSSKWLKTWGERFAEFRWQNGYGAFSIGQSTVEEVKAYIANQAEHHRVRTFQDEFRALLKKYEIEFDERYVWD
jgi:REP element-mobilizing transposase RayT